MAQVLFPDEVRRTSLQDTAYGYFQGEISEIGMAPREIYRSWMDDTENGIPTGTNDGNRIHVERMNRRRQIVAELPFVAHLQNAELQNPVREKRSLMRNLLEHYRTRAGRPGRNNDYLLREEWTQIRLFLREIRILLAHRALAYYASNGQTNSSTLPNAHWHCVVASIACISVDRRFQRILPIHFEDLKHSQSTIAALYYDCGEGDHPRIQGVEINTLHNIADGLGFVDDVAHIRLFVCAVECMMSGKSQTLQTFRPTDDNGNPMYFPIGMNEERKFCVDTLRLIEREEQARDCLRVINE